MSIDSQAENFELSTYISKQLVGLRVRKRSTHKFEQWQHFILVLFDWQFLNSVLNPLTPTQATI